MDCDLQESSETTLTMRVRTIDGVARSATLPVEDDNNCSPTRCTASARIPTSRFLPLDVAYSGASSIVDEGGPAFRMAISLTTYTRSR